MKKKKKTELKVTYQFVEPKTEEEKEEQERRVNKAYDFIFDAMLQDDVRAR